MAAMKSSLRMIGSILLGGMLVISCGEKKKEAQNPANIPVQVNTRQVAGEKALYYDNFPGTVVALMQVDLRPVAEGYVTGIFFKEGDHVKKGQRLYTIDDTKYRADVNQSQANERVAEANQDQAQKDADRYIYLNQHDAVAKQLLDHALTTLQNAKHQVTAAKQDLAKSQTNLAYSIIKAPFDGTIGISQVKMGTTVNTGQTVLNTVSSIDPMAVDIIVNEKQIPRFVRMQQQNFREADSIFTFILPDNSIYNRVGRISFVDRGVNPQTGSITVRLTFPNPSYLLRAGMSGVVRVRNDDTSRQLLVPSKAIVEQMGEYFVFIAKDTLIPSADATKKNAPAEHAGLHALQKKVLTGQTIGDRVIIRSGLHSGDELVVDGIQKLHDGSLITTGAPGAPQQGAGH
jgi:membrane fusion protein (multidrug efflux system)